MVLRRIIPFLTAVLLILTFGAACAESHENLLKNSDFVHIGNEGLPDGWYTDAYILEPGYSEFSISEGDPDHPIALYIRNFGENDARFAQTVEVEPETLYCLSGYVRAENVEGGHGANLSVEGIYAFSDRYFDTEGEWEYIEYYGETGPDQDQITVFARLGGYSGVSTGKAWFADLSLTKADSVPDDWVADLWYRQDTYDDYDDEEETEPDTPADIRIWLFLIGSIYTVGAIFIICNEHKRNTILPSELNLKSFHTNTILTVSVLLLSFAIRMIICWLVEGYMVDVNCFLSWGHTMASVGPTRFYEATSFCDYPPLYTYVLALNSAVSHMFGGSEAVSRIVFRFIPSLCDIAGCWLLYHMLRREKAVHERSCFLFLTFAVFNPASILNSAAWGQMDAVLCMLLVCVALYAVKGKWMAALPLYVVSVLIKPQALMLGPLGLVYIIITWIQEHKSRRQILIGTGISILTLAAGVIPFSIHQEWDWLINLYSKTLASYPYATVNTANIYYLLGGNWSPVDRAAHVLAPVLLGILSGLYGIWWYHRARELRGRIIESVISYIFTAFFTVLAFLQASWAWTGGTAMAFAFIIVISSAVRNKDIKLLPWLGGLLFILLYVFGVKMHERYLFPAFLLLSAAWVIKRDRRILYVILLFSFTVFINEGIVLDNSIRLGSQQGHLLSDTVWIADLISLINVFGSIYAVWLSVELWVPEKNTKLKNPEKLRTPLNWQCERKLYWNRKDTILLTTVTIIYSVVTLLTLGSTKAPQTGWVSSSATEQIIFDLGQERDNIEILYFSQVSRNDFSFSSSIDGENWTEESWAQMDQGQCWKWKYVTESYEDGSGNRTYYNSDENNIIRFSGRYIRLTSHQLGLRLNEILFRSPDGEVLPVQISGQYNADPDSDLYSDPRSLIDEQDSMESLPSFPENEENRSQKIQPSWWNSTYFDEIYHARTAYEFLQGSVPYETSHPPLGKVIMSAWVAVFGMTPFGWRFAGALAGILMLPGMYLLGKQLTKKTWIALLSCLLMTFDCMHFTQTQIATIDSFPVLFIIFAYFFMLRFINTDVIREKLSISLSSLFFSGLFMGLSIASKWIGIYAGAGLAILFFWHCYRTIRMQKEADDMLEAKDLSDDERERLRSGTVSSGAPSALHRAITICAWCVLFFIIIPVVIYLVSYIPYMAYNTARIHSLGDYISEVWRSQIGMFNYHSTPNLGMDHPFYSPWWEWPIIGKPMYYASQQYLPANNPVHHSIFAFGNPVIWYGGLGAVLLCVLRSVVRRRYLTLNSDILWHLHPVSFDTRYIFLLTGLLAQYLPWVLVPRGTYIYHYFASLPFLMTAICLCFDGEDHHERLRIIIAVCIMAVSAVFFILLFPYASGMNVSAEWLNIGKSILRIWY